ncbi:anaphase-promoting complex subunit cut9 [Dichotomopilus funicola]|uniref:Anaphase-promoting complex subunit cut9 n=1 Tax=Dichotomopilus funicola TaxID=1934379 RepID=A0AAN6VBY8_9PEZI|nr:anaphase-promoting complex subunit cut9 [Dichotomopilus funicola]
MTSQPNMERFLRDWRQDALNKAQYESAIFIGDKLLALTRDDNDAFWLAQVHFAAGHHARAHDLLRKHSLIGSNPSCRYLAAHCLIKQGCFAEALGLLGEVTPAHLLVAGRRAKRKIVAGGGGHDRAQSQNKNQIQHNQQAQEEAKNEEEWSTRRYEAGMCYLRGLCYAKENAFDRAKEAYKDALRIDVQCYEAFTQLVRNALMSADEEAEFMQSLDFNGVRAVGPGGDGDGNGEGSDLQTEPGDYVQMLYQTHLSKYGNPGAFNTAVESLSTHYGLAENADLLLARADLLYTQCRFKDALVITSSILQDDKTDFPAYPIHLACLYELRQTNELFLVAHDLADHHPDHACTWLAVGTYYLATGKIADARRYFSKSSMMDATFGPAWIGFAHTFAAEGEHDQAITAYSTAARLFTGTHLPPVFLGMQNHAMNNMTAAEEYLKSAYQLCRTDPLLLNEMGVVLYHQGRLKDSAKFFRQALLVAADTGADPRAWLGARTNLAHAYRRMRYLDAALEEFDAVLRDGGGKNAAVLCAKALILLDSGRADDAARVLHEALAVNPQDPVATELLNKALEEAGVGDVVVEAGSLVGRLNAGGLDLEEEEEEEDGNGGEEGGEGEGNPELAAMDRFEAELEGRKMAARARMMETGGGGRRGRGGGLGGGGGIEGDDAGGDVMMDTSDDF